MFDFLLTDLVPILVAAVVTVLTTVGLVKNEVRSAKFGLKPGVLTKVRYVATLMYLLVFILIIIGAR